MYNVYRVYIWFVIYIKNENKKQPRLSGVVQIYNLIAWDLEAGRSEVQSYLSSMMSFRLAPSPLGHCVESEGIFHHAIFSSRGGGMWG